MTATDQDLLALTRAGRLEPAAYAGLFALINELSECEKRRDELFDRLSVEEKCPDRSGSQNGLQHRSGNLPAGRRNEADNGGRGASSTRTGSQWVGCAIDSADRLGGPPGDRSPSAALESRKTPPCSGHDWPAE
jgi:hypothetical protein